MMLMRAVRKTDATRLIRATRRLMMVRLAAGRAQDPVQAQAAQLPVPLTPAQAQALASAAVAELSDPESGRACPAFFVRRANEKRTLN